MTVRNYSSRSQQTTLTGPITAGATSMVVQDGDALLGGQSIPGGTTFTVVLDPDTALEEIVDCTVVSTNTFTITRGIEAGGTGQSHSAGAVVRHMAIGRDFRDANLHTQASASYNDGSGVGVSLHGIAAGEGDVVGTLKAQVLGSKTLATNLDAGNFKIVNLAAPTASGDAASKNYVDTGVSSGVVAAQSSAAQAAVSATAASTSAANAAASATAASTSASNASVSAIAASTSAASASVSAIAANTSAVAANTSAIAASTSAASAAVSATSANASVSAVQTFAIAASTSAASAAASATAASTSAASALVSANSASAAASQAASAIQATIFDAKGDIIVASAADTAARLGVGSDGQILTAASTATYGIQWAAAPVSLPSQTGNAGKYLTTDGTTASWAAITTDPTPSVFLLMGA